MWRSIIELVDIGQAQNEFITVTNLSRATLGKHPWSIGGGGAADLKEQIEAAGLGLITVIEPPIGRAVRIAEEEAFMFDSVRKRHSHATNEELRGFLLGEKIRDWQSSHEWWVWYPYCEASRESRILRDLWQWRTTLENRSTFQGVMADAGLEWYEYMQHTASAYSTPLSIAFAFVATHNHFVLDRGGKVFNRSAPIIKLPGDATEDDHLALLGLLNSSTACFWMKQVFHNKGAGGVNEGFKQEDWEQFREFAGTGLGAFPFAESRASCLPLARLLDRLGQEYVSSLPDAVVRRATPTQANLDEARAKTASLRGRMIALQEELDWQCYQLYGLLDEDLRYPGDDLPELALGQRAFEIVMARQMAKGELQTSWFERHGSTPITEIPDDWPETYRNLVARRIKTIETNKEIDLIERPEYKRRWNDEPWDDQQQRALRNWLLDRLESPHYWPDANHHAPALQSTAQLADEASGDHDFLQVAALYRGRPDFHVAALVAELVESESVPFLPVLRYKPAGLRKREVWERTWDLQRKQDAGEDVGDIPVPPKYASADFLKSDLLAAPGQARRVQGAVDQLPAPSDRERSQPGRWLGGVGPPPAGDCPGGLLRSPQARGLGRQAANAHPDRARPAPALDSAVASRNRPRVRRHGGPVVSGHAGARRPRAWIDDRRDSSVEAPRESRKAKGGRMKRTKVKPPTVYVIAGPNGAGKTTFASEFLPGFVQCREFLNADLIAAGLSPFAPETQNVRAGRLFLERIRELVGERADFGFETTLSGRTYVKLLGDMKAGGYRLVLFFLWLPSAEMAVARVEIRVKRGGHRVPPEDIERRYAAGLRNFFRLYRPIVDSWWLYDASRLPPKLIASEERGQRIVKQRRLYRSIEQHAENDHEEGH